MIDWNTLADAALAHEPQLVQRPNGILELLVGFDSGSQRVALARQFLTAGASPWCELLSLIDTEGADPSQLLQDNGAEFMHTGAACEQNGQYLVRHTAPLVELSGPLLVALLIRVAGRAQFLTNRYGT